MAVEGTISLKELKKQNEKEAEELAKAEEATLKAKEDSLYEDDLGDNDELTDDENQVSGDDDADPDDSGEGDAAGDDSERDPDADDQDPDKETKAEDWMLDDEGNAPDPEKKYTDSDAGKIRKKYKGTIDELKQEIAQLKEAKPQPGTQKPIIPNVSDLKEPDRDKFKSDLEYLEARQDYKAEIARREMLTHQQAQQFEQKQTEAEQKANEELDSHYARAHALVQKSGIKPERYQEADTIVRKTLEERFPGSGEKVTDSLIARLGEGSEKVIFNLGVNKERMNTFLGKFDSDPSGLSSAMYLESLKAKLGAGGNTRSNAPPPPHQLGGDGKPDGGQKRALLKAYRTAHSKRDGQAAWAAKKKAKAAGIDVSEW